MAKVDGEAVRGLSQEQLAAAVARVVGEAAGAAAAAAVEVQAEFRGQVSVRVPSEALAQVLPRLRDDSELAFDMLADLTCVHFPRRALPLGSFDVVYHLLSLSRGHRLRVKVSCPDPERGVASATPTWPGANYMEREAHDMFGVRFHGHPDLRRILMGEDFDGWPLRKDFPYRGALMKQDWKDVPGAGEGLAGEAIWHEEVTTTFERVADDVMVVNMGPQHPSTHGVLRMMITLDGERVLKLDPVLGYLHRGMEKLAEVKTFNQYIPWTDRWDYLANLQNNVAFAMTVEKLMGVEVPIRARRLRVLACELARISSHLVWLGTHAIDMGGVTVFFWAYREREKLLSLFEMLCGARITTSYTRIGGVMRDLPPGYEDAVRLFLDQFPRALDEMETLLTRNKIWMVRTKEVGVISREDAIRLSITGPILRAAGSDYDVRRAFPYLDYEEFDFDVPTGEIGDVYDRYLVRMEEMRQSVRICEQVLAKLEPGPVEANDGKVVLPSKERVLTRMEDLIHQFMLVTEGPNTPTGEVYHAIEGAKGELGLYLVSDGGGRAYRLRIRGPSFVNMQCLAPMAEGGLIADLIAIVASLDPVLGEVDR